MQAESLASTADMYDRDPCAERAAALLSAQRLGLLQEACDRVRLEPVPRHRSASTWMARLLWLDAELRAAGLD